MGDSESMGSWSLRASPALKWSGGGRLGLEELELPVDGVYVYKYVVTDAADAGKPVAWQKGNNQVLTLLASDAPALIAQDDWSGTPRRRIPCARTARARCRRRRGSCSGWGTRTPRCTRAAWR